MKMGLQQTASVPTHSVARPSIQMKARIGSIDDPLEREADKIADAVVTGCSVGAISSAAPGTAHRKCTECEVEEKKATAQARKRQVDSNCSGGSQSGFCSGRQRPVDDA